MNVEQDTDEIIRKEIKDTLEKSKKLQSDKPNSTVTAEHFHSYEYLISLLARRQAISNYSLDKMTRQLLVLTWVVVGIGVIQIVLTLATLCLS